MIRKLFVQIIIIAVVVCFFGLNFSTEVDIKFWFNNRLTIEGVSLFIALAAAYLLGVITLLPLYIIRGIKKNRESKELKSQVDE